MPDVGPMEIGLIVLVIFLLFGASRLPKLGRSMGQSIRGFKQGLTEDLPPEDEPSQVTAAVTIDEAPAQTVAAKVDETAAPTAQAG
jgi:sec-independent protein translocase protein TatA